MTSSVDSNTNEPNINEPNANDSDDAIIGVALKWSLVVIAIGSLPIVLWLIFSGDNKTANATIPDAALPSVRRIVEQSIPKIPMTDITSPSGVRFVHQSGRRGERLLPETMGSGVAVFDANGDGNLDLFFINSTTWPWDNETSDDRGHSKTSELYLGDGTGTFTDATKGSGLNLTLYGMGVAIGDIDNDGDRDVFVSAVGKNRLLQNETVVASEPRFVDVTEQSNVGGDPSDWSTSCGFFDYDRDGWLDLFVCNYVTWSRENDLAQSFTLDGQSRAYGPPRAFAGSFSRLYHNDGGGRFTDVSKVAGIEILSPDTRVPLGKSMGVVFADVNVDGYPDIVVSNDTVPNFLFENQRDGTFREVAGLSGIATDRSGAARGAMGIDCAYLRNDDTLAIGIGNFANEPSALYMTRPGGGQFVDAAMFTGFGPPTRQGLTFGFLFIDLDLDGRLDIIGANGHLEEEISRTQSSQTYAQSPQLFWNAGTEASSELVLLTGDSIGDDALQPIVGRGAAGGDFDNDGDVDWVVTTSHGPAKLFRNDQSTGHPALTIRLRPASGCADAIGAIVTLRQGDRALRRCVNPTSSYLSQSSPEISLGLADWDLEKTAELSIQWPDGETQVVPIDLRSTVIALDQP